MGDAAEGGEQLDGGAVEQSKGTVEKGLWEIRKWGKICSATLERKHRGVSTNSL